MAEWEMARLALKTMEMNTTTGKSMPPVRIPVVTHCVDVISRKPARRWRCWRCDTNLELSH